MGKGITNQKLILFYCLQIIITKTKPFNSKIKIQHQD